MRISNRLKFIFILIIGLFFLAPSGLARENATDWYIKDFSSEIKVNTDSTLDITEKITADCGDCVNKHGIFRILPERINIQGKNVKTPVELISITDFDGKGLPYSVSRNLFDGTITWKIGDSKKTVQGINLYQIHYRVKNAIRFDNPKFDELYWNLNGNFWGLETDKFSAVLIFPAAVNQTNATVEYYTGGLGDRGKSLADYSWTSPNVLEFTSSGTLASKQGITASIIFPKYIFTPYRPGWLETYGQYLFLLFPLFVFIVSFYLWRQYGKDPKMSKTVIPEYEIPGGLTPLEAGLLMTNGVLKNNFITAAIINLAVKGLITIKESGEKSFFRSVDYVFTKNSSPEVETSLSQPEKIILEKIFSRGGEVKLSSLKNEFYKALKEIKKETIKILTEKELIAPIGLSFQIPFIIMGAILIILSFPLGFMFFSFYLFLSAFLSGLIIFIFGLIMPKRTLAGAEMNWQAKGFKLFMQTVDKYRAEFYEKEYIFEKFLPYAIIFGITGIWIKKMKEIYGPDFYSTHVPIWYAGSLASFNADNFSATMDSLSAGIAASTSSPSGSGGAGGAGGGGGGGGGGGW